MLNQFDLMEPRELGERLRAARVRAGLTQDAAASKLDVARTTLVAIEKGQRKVRPDELRALAGLYRQSINTLLRPTAVAVDLVPRFRALSEAEHRPAADAAQLLNDLAAGEAELERLVGQPSRPTYPAERPIGPGDLREQAEDLAMEARQRLGLGLSPISDMVSLLELDLGVRVFVRPLASGAISGLFVYDDDLGACILLNQNHPRERRALTAAHELGHLLTARRRPDVLDLDQATHSREERFASHFAAALMMPAALVRRRVQDLQRETGRFSPRHLILLAHYLNVSEEALCRRLEELRLVPGGTWDSLKERRFNGDLVRQVLGDEARAVDAVMPPRLWLLAAEAHRRDLLTEGQLARLLRMDLVEVRAMLDAIAPDGPHDLESLTAT
jgi:Zn-dependent peptidase ImmA (M78 family)/DNA-binding XRE family transcriptional regulator